MIYKFGFLIMILHMINSKSSINDNKDLPIICHKHVKVYVGKCFKNANQWLYVRIRCYENWIENQFLIVYVWVKKKPWLGYSDYTKQHRGKHEIHQILK